MACCIGAGLGFFLAGAFAAIWVGFATYALANDQVSAVALWALPIAWIIASSLTMLKIAKSGRSVWNSAAILIVASPVVGFGAIWTISWSRASAILSQQRSVAEATVRRETPFAFLTGSAPTYGWTYSDREATLTLLLNRAPPKVLADYRTLLPRSWVQYRDWSELHVFASPMTPSGFYKISVDISGKSRTSVHLRKSRRALVPTDARANFRALND